MSEASTNQSTPEVEEKSTVIHTAQVGTVGRVEVVRVYPIERTQSGAPRMASPKSVLRVTACAESEWDARVLAAAIAASAEFLNAE